MMFKVELRPHVGQKFIPGLGTMEVQFDQWMIFITGEGYKQATGRDELHAGYVAKQAVVVHDGVQYQTPINWLQVMGQWPQNVLDALAGAVQTELAEMEGADPVDVELAAAGQSRPQSAPPPIPVPTSSQAAEASQSDNL